MGTSDTTLADATVAREPLGSATTCRQQVWPFILLSLIAAGVALGAPTIARAQEASAEHSITGSALLETGAASPLLAFGGASAVVILLSLVTWAILKSRRLDGSSLFNRLFIVVATTSAFFSGVSSAIGFSLITSQETDDYFRNVVLPPAFGMFVFFLAVAIWVGGAELVRHRDWFRFMRRGFLADGFFFFERAIKLFILIPILATILFFVSTWTTVVGIGGVDAVRHTYDYEVSRLQTDCAGISAHRQKDFLFLEDLRLAVNDVSRVARNEATRGDQSGSSGNGAVAAYFVGVAEWLEGLEGSVASLIAANQASDANPYNPASCAEVTEDLTTRLASNAFDNYDLWAREFETTYNDFAVTLNRWRRDRRIETLLDQQLSNFDRANPRPGNVSRRQARAIDDYAEQVESALKSLLRKQRLAKPPAPVPSAATLSPARGLSIVGDIFATPSPEAPEDEDRVSRTQSYVYDEERIDLLSTISPRDAVLKNANIFSDIWALAIAWDYASYVLMLAYLFFPSAERAAGYKD